MHQTPRTPIARAASVLLLGLSALIGAAGCATTQKTNHLLIMGGGSKPESNQVSLEKNVNYFYRVIDRLGLTDAQRDILFACGDKPEEKDVQYIAYATDNPQTNRMINVLIGPGKDQSKKYRPHDIGGGEIASSQEHIVKWFDDHAPTLTADDNLLLYFTGHGGKGEKKNTQNTSLYLWPKHNMRMKPFVAELDKLDTQTPVVMVMVQCYSGGFANVIFKEGDPEKGLSEHNRCGFFASVHSRPAAGCTPNVNEADYKEYSSYFWAALSGEDRLGVPVDRPDYNGDGVTNYLEAHAFAMIHSDSTDLSMCTTDRLVRAVEVAVPEGTEGVLTEASGYPSLHAAADPVRKAILDGLSDRLALTGDDRVAQAKAALEQVKKDQRAIQLKRAKAIGSMNSERKKLLEKLTEQWPALKVTKSEEAMAAVIKDAEAMRKAIAEDESFTKINQNLDELIQLKKDRDAQIAKKAHAERFLYTCSTVMKTDTLLRFGKPEYFKAYYQLLERELASPTP